MSGKLRTYIAGPMRGKPFFNRAAFEKAATAVRDEGAFPVSPSNLDRVIWDFDGEGDLPDCITPRSVFRIDLPILAECDAIYMLHDWEKSRGAILELAYAKVLGLLVMYAPDALVADVGAST